MAIHELHHNLLNDVPVVQAVEPSPAPHTPPPTIEELITTAMSRDLPTGYRETLQGVYNRLNSKLCSDSDARDDAKKIMAHVDALPLPTPTEHYTEPASTRRSLSPEEQEKARRRSIAAARALAGTALTLVDPLRSSTTKGARTVL